MKNISFFICKFSVSGGEISIYLNRRGFVMVVSEQVFIDYIEKLSQVVIFPIILTIFILSSGTDRPKQTV